jgi:hypothetical protein
MLYPSRTPILEHIMRKLIALAVIALVGAPLMAAPARAQNCSAPGQGWVAAENSKPGDPTWSKGVPFRLSADFSRRKVIDRAEGYFDATSLRCGESSKLTLVGTKNVRVEIYRMGYYDGDGARRLASISVRNGWNFNASEKYLPGQYLFKLQAPNRAATFVPLVINSPEIESDLTFISSVLTWQTYNQWGGYSLYKGADGKRETRASEVSFARPYDGDGSGQFRYMEYPVIRAAEKLGLSINYATDFDLDRNPNLTSKTNAVVFGGHSEYWTTQMRDAVEAAVDRGVNLIVLGGNTAYNQIVIKDETISDVTPWRDLGRPEVILLGSQYFSLGFKRDMVVETNLWPFDVLKPGAIIKGVVGYEADTPITFNGPPVETIARSSILPFEKSVPSMATYYTRPSGAGILNMATNGWVCAIEDRCPWGHRFDKATQRQIRVVTENILKGAALGPLGNWRMAFTQYNAPS